MLKTPAPKKRVTIFQFASRNFVLTANEIMYMLNNHPALRDEAEKRGALLGEIMNANKA